MELSAINYLNFKHFHVLDKKDLTENYRDKFQSNLLNILKDIFYLNLNLKIRGIFLSIISLKLLIS